VPRLRSARANANSASNAAKSASIEPPPLSTLRSPLLAVALPLAVAAAVPFALPLMLSFADPAEIVAFVNT
jgi:hypothetical protein